MKTCSVPGCARKHKGHGWCKLHYDRWRRHGDPLGVATGYQRGPKKRPTGERFWAKVAKSDGCWIWLGAKDSKGYGRFNKGEGLSSLSHRYAYESLVGAVPNELQLDHLCRVPSCVNPEHLEPVTPLENTRRGRGHGSETHCPLGHPYDETNTYRRPDGKSRVCRTCTVTRWSR